MKEFASALLVRLVRSHLAAQGLLPSSAMIPRDLAEAKLELRLKRDLLARVREEHGLGPLLSVGRSLHHLCPDPVVEVLTKAADPHDALSRWQRLERFVHSRHRLIVADKWEQDFIVAHSDQLGKGRPRPEEHAVILSVLAALCRVAGARDLKVVDVASSETVMTVAEGSHNRASIPDIGELWHFRWTDAGQDVEKIGDRPTPAPSNGASADLLATIRALIAGDLSLSWTLPRLGQRLGLSQRTLQRRLAAEGAGIAALVRSARVEAAGRLLTETTHSLAEIGFVCGFSDQAHFTALFKRQTALTPAAFRRAFA